MTPLEEILYRQLLGSKSFHRWVRKLHARINNIKFEEEAKIVHADSFRPTRIHKFNAFKVIWKDELLRAFGIRR